ncbi:MAG: DUF882 domain-containing protein [Elusimicrobiota bacterium]
MSKRGFILTFCLTLSLVGCREKGDKAESCGDSSPRAYAANSKEASASDTSQAQSRLGSAGQSAVQARSLGSGAAADAESLRHNASRTFDGAGSLSGLTRNSAVYAGGTSSYPPRPELKMQQPRKFRSSAQEPPSPQLGAAGAGSLSIRNDLGEKITVAYKNAAGRINAGALQQISRIFRDERNGKYRAVPVGLVDTLAKIQQRFGNKTIHLVSGYRSPETNSKLRQSSKKVAKNSLHMQGIAADIQIPGVSSYAVAKYAKSLKAGGVGTYSTFVHVDIGGVRYW